MTSAAAADRKDPSLHVAGEDQLALIDGVGEGNRKFAIDPVGFGCPAEAYGLSADNRLLVVQYSVADYDNAGTALGADTPVGNAAACAAAAGTGSVLARQSAV